MLLKIYTKAIQFSFKKHMYIYIHNITHYKNKNINKWCVYIRNLFDKIHKVYIYICKLVNLNTNIFKTRQVFI